MEAKMLKRVSPAVLKTINTSMGIVFGKTGVAEPPFEVLAVRPG